MRIKLVLHIILIFSCTTSVLSQTAQKFIFDEQDQTTIPYANIYIKDGNKGWVSDKNGAFIYKESEIKPTDVLVISALGYQQKQTPFFLVKDCTLIHLKARPVTLKEVEIKARRYKRARLGKKRKANGKSYTGIRNHVIYERDPEAIFIKNDIGAEGIIDELKIFIKKGSIIPFKIQLYDAHLIDGSPKNKLLEKPLIIKETEDRTWLSIKVIRENISIPKQGFFVAIDWNIDSAYYEKPDTLVREIHYTNVKKTINDTTISQGVVIGEHFTHSWNRWKKGDNKGWYNFWEYRYINYSSKIEGYDRNTTRYQTFAIYANILYDKSAIKYQEDVLDNNGIADEKLTKKIIKKKVGRVKEKKYRYPQSTLNELLTSTVTTLKNDNIPYLLTHLCFYTFEELELIRDNEKMICDENCKKKLLEQYRILLDNIENMKLYELENNYYQLTSKNITTTVLFNEGRWKISPTITTN